MPPFFRRLFVAFPALVHRRRALQINRNPKAAAKMAEGPTLAPRSGVASGFCKELNSK